MKKLLVMILALATTLCVLFTAGCSNNTPTPAPTPSNPPSTTEPTEEPAPETPASTGTGTDTDPFNISDIPDYISELYWWEVDDFGYTPQVINKTSTDQYDIVISVPQLPEKLANFAQSRGDLYVLVTAKSKNDDRQQADLYFYSGSMVLMYDRTASYLMDGGGEGNVSYSFYSGNILFPTITNVGMVRGTEAVYMNANTTQDEFSDTSYTPTEEEMDAIMNAL